MESLDPNSLFLVLVGALAGFLLRLLWEQMAQPRLTPGSVKMFVLTPGGLRGYQACRLGIRNRERRLLNSVAKNCTAKLVVPGKLEEFQLSWAPGDAAVSINVGDERDLDLCAYEVFSKTVVAPTERGYFTPEPRTIMDTLEPRDLGIRITCENGRPLVLKIHLEKATEGLSVRLVE